MKINQDILSKVDCVQIDYSNLGRPGVEHIEAAKLWIENELFCRECVEVDELAVRKLVEDCELSEEDALIQAAIDALDAEFCSLQEFADYDYAVSAG